MKEGDRLNSVFFAEFYCTFFSFFFFLFVFFFCFHAFQEGKRQNLLFMIQMSLFIYCSDTIYVLFMRSTATLYKKNIKNRSHDTIHTFKNYFVIVFLIFSFHDNKLNSNLSKIFHLRTYELLKAKNIISRKRH